MLNGIKKVLKYVPARSVERKNAALIIERLGDDETDSRLAPKLILVASFACNFLMIGVRVRWIAEIPKTKKRIEKLKAKIQKSRVSLKEEQIMDETLGISIGIQEKFMKLESLVVPNKLNVSDRTSQTAI